MIALASNLIRELGARLWKVMPTIRPEPSLPTGQSEARPARLVRNVFNRNTSPAETVPVLTPDALRAQHRTFAVVLEVLEETLVCGSALT
jgi:hypothetical protein